MTQSLRATVKNGHLVIDEPTDLPEGAVVHLMIVQDNEELSAEDRADLRSRLARAREDVAAGRTVDAHDFMKKLAERRP